MNSYISFAVASEIGFPVSFALLSLLQLSLFLRFIDIWEVVTICEKRDI